MINIVRGQLEENTYLERQASAYVFMVGFCV